MSAHRARPIRLLTFEEALAHNLSVVQERAPRSQVWAVAKARGYGHGLAAAVRGFASASGLAVLEMQEAVLAREWGWQKPILLLEGCFHPSEVLEAADLGLDLVVHHVDQLDWLSTRMSRMERASGRIWIKLNTGMNRLGFAPHTFKDLAPRVADLRRLLGPQRLAWMTHLAKAEQPEATIRPLGQLDLALRELGVSAQEPVSVCNSAGVFTLPQAHHQWVRPGIALYGGSPLESPLAPEHTASQLQLKAAGSLRSQVISVQTLQAGEPVGYGERYRAPHPMRIGVVAGGYADGLQRNAPDGTPVWVAGQVCPLVGRVSMDMVTVDLSSHPRAGVGSAVEFWGQELPIDKVAQACGTISYELMTGITERVARQVIPALPLDDDEDSGG
jgi:alanine racemase